MQSIMNEIEKSILLGKYEKIKGYSSNLFNYHEWLQFDAFCKGYSLCRLEMQQENKNA